MGWGRNKLRIYRLFKHNFDTSHYLKYIHLTCAQHSVMDKMRCRVAPVCLETGWYEGLILQERICSAFDMEEIESEIHVMNFCSLHNDIRATLHDAALSLDNDVNR